MTFVKLCSLNCLPTSRIMGKTVEVTLQLPSQLISQATEQFADESLDKIVLMALKSYVKNQSNG